MYRYFDHTADLGFHVEAATLPELFEDAGCALFGAMIENLDDVKPTVEMTLTVATARLDDLLHDWLADLLAMFETEHLVACRFQVAIEDTEEEFRATAKIAGERFDEDRHEVDAVVKAVTYHGLEVESTDDGYEANVIVDL